MRGMFLRCAGLLGFALGVACSSDGSEPATDENDDDTRSQSDDDTSAGDDDSVSDDQGGAGADGVGGTSSDDDDDTSADDDDAAGDDDDDENTNDDTGGSDDDDAPVEYTFGDLPIPIAFVGFYPPGQADKVFAISPLIEGCPIGDVVNDDGDVVTQTIWSDCAAEKIVVNLNEAYRDLLGTDITFFESAGFTTLEHAEYHTFSTRSQLEDAIKVLNDSEFAEPGLMRAFVSSWNAPFGGFAPVDVALDDEHGVVIGLDDDFVGNYALIHEVGHALGLEHTNEDRDGDGTLEYNACGEALSVPISPECECDGNYMASGGESDACPPCRTADGTFRTPKHEDFQREVIACWFSTRRYLGKRQKCTILGIASCEGYAASGSECLCADGMNTVQISSCDFESADLDAIDLTCGDEGNVVTVVEPCTNARFYPGVYCYQGIDGSYDCDCWNGAGSFSADDCDTLSDAEVYAACLGADDLTSCQSTSERLSCVETAPEELTCICTDDGRSFRLNGTGATCAASDLDEVEENCN